MVVRRGRVFAARIPAGAPGVRSCRSSLLVGIPREPAGVQLLLRATQAQAFRVLAEELSGLAAGTGLQSPLVDLHLETPAAVHTRLGPAHLSAADRSAMDQAVGALLDQGRLPAEALDELDRLGSELAVRSAVAARLLLRGLVIRDGPENPDSRNQDGMFTCP